MKLADRQQMQIMHEGRLSELTEEREVGFYQDFLEA